MKICKNNFDICLCYILYCPKCSFRVGHECKWLHTVGKVTSGCGGIKSRNLSDIFKL